MPNLKLLLKRLITGPPLRALEKSYIKSQIRRTVFEPTPTIGIIQIGSGFATLYAYTQTDPLIFRAFFAIGTVTGTLIPNFYRKPKLILPFVWGLTFLGVNLTRISELLSERKPVSFGEQEMKLYEQTFYEYITPKQFHTLLTKAATFTTVPANETLKHEGVNATDLTIVLAGTLNLSSLSKLLSTISSDDGHYRLTGIPRDLTQPGSDTDNKMVTITTLDECTVMQINLEQLADIVKNDVGLNTGLLKLFHERLLQKVLVRDKQISVQTYHAMIEYAVQGAAVNGGDGVINPEVKRGLKKFRKEHDIDKAEHVSALKKVGWSSEDWHAGSKEDVAGSSGGPGASNGAGPTGVLMSRLIRLSAKKAHDEHHAAVSNASKLDHDISSPVAVVAVASPGVDKSEIQRLRNKKLMGIMVRSFDDIVNKKIESHHAVTTDSLLKPVQIGGTSSAVTSASINNNSTNNDRNNINNSYGSSSGGGSMLERVSRRRRVSVLADNPNGVMSSNSKSLKAVKISNKDVNQMSLKHNSIQEFNSRNKAAAKNAHSSGMKGGYSTATSGSTYEYINTVLNRNTPTKNYSQTYDYTGNLAEYGKKVGVDMRRRSRSREDVAPQSEPRLKFNNLSTDSTSTEEGSRDDRDDSIGGARNLMDMFKDPGQKESPSEKSPKRR
jgi:hypothetical protein